MCSKPEEVGDAETENTNSVEIIIKLTSENSLNDHDHNVSQETERDTETLCTEIRPNHNRVSKGLCCLYANVLTLYDYDCEVCCHLH